MDDQPVASTSGLQNKNITRSNSKDHESLNDLAIARILQNDFDSQRFGDKPNKIAPQDDDDDDDGSQVEYEVEAIRAKRINSKTCMLEYYVKWEGYPENQNTWEPSDNLKCPELVAQFEEAEKLKRERKRRNNSEQNLNQSQAPQSQSKRPRTKITARNNLPKDNNDVDSDNVVEKRNNEPNPSTSTLNSNSNSTSTSTSTSTASLTSSKPNENPSTVDDRAVKGFSRKKPIDRIIGSCVDSDDKIFFFVKFKDVTDIDLIDIKELEDRAPRELCHWYRERLYYSLNNTNQHNQCQGDEKNGSGQMNNKSSTSTPTPVA